MANNGKVANYFGTSVYLKTEYVNMLEPIQCAEVIHINVVYTQYPSYSFVICRFQMGN